MRFFSFPPLLFACAGVAALSVSCAPLPPPPPPVRAERVMYQWHDDGGSGEVKVFIRLSEQIAEFKRGGRDIGWSYVATGKEGHGTKPGSYRITEKIVDKYSNRYGWWENEYGEIVKNSARYDERVPPGLKYVPAPMPYWMRLTSYGIGLHAGPIPQPGVAVSHGCIRLPNDFAPVLYSVVRVGTEVAITR